MAATDGGAKPSLIDRLLAEPYRFSFFQAVLLLHKVCPDAVDIGGVGPPAAEPVRFTVNTSMGFPKSDIATVTITDGNYGPPYCLSANFLGLHGSTSPLPGFYAEDVLQDTQAEGILAAFMDLFHHRLLSLFYRCWLRFRPHFLFAHNGTDGFSRAMFALTGLGENHLVEASGFAAVRYLRFAGLITQKPHGAASLRGMLAEYFDGVPVHIRQTLGRWLPVEPAQRARLSSDTSYLGRSFIIGDRIHDRLSKFRVIIGPLDFATYLKFLPGGDWNTALKKLVRLFCVDQLDFDIELILKSEETPSLRLDLSGKSQLGWTTGFFAAKRARKDVAVVFA
jgi:type VI secretion system protein ImpH